MGHWPAINISLTVWSSLVELTSYEEFLRVSRNDKYYHSERWKLYERVQQLIAARQPESVLELGSYRLPLVVESDTMDRSDRFSPTVVHDACVTPWPVADERYDLFVALQVWEHLLDRQQAAFREVRRIARSAILSFPYRWDCKKRNPSHHGITEEVIASWTEGCPPTLVEIIPSRNNHRRIIYVFDFEEHQSLRTEVLQKEEHRLRVCIDAPPTFRREPAECRYRTHVQTLQGDETARCQFVELQLAKAGKPAEVPVRVDACRVCVTEAEPTPACFNTVVSSLAFSKLAELSSSEEKGPELARLIKKAEGGLRLVKRNSRQSSDEDQRVFGDCRYVAVNDRNGETHGCQHERHYIATPEICHLCSDHQFKVPLKQPKFRDCLVYERQGNPVQRWMVGVTTSPRDPSTVNQTLDSVVRAGWSSPWVFMDGAVQLSPRHRHLPVTFRESRSGAWPNYFLALSELLHRDPDADAYAVIQDDVLLANAENLKTYLEEVLWPDPSVGVVSLYCPSVYHQESAGWHQLEQKWIWGALAFIFSNESAWAFISDPEVIAHRRSQQFDGLRQIDTTVGQWIRRTKRQILYPVPSLARHIGEQSTLWQTAIAGGKRQASAFLR